MWQTGTVVEEKVAGGEYQEWESTHLHNIFTAHMIKPFDSYVTRHFTRGNMPFQGEIVVAMG